MTNAMKHFISWLLGLIMGLATGVALGMYLLPIIIAAKNADAMTEQKEAMYNMEEISIMQDSTLEAGSNYTASFNSNAADSDFLHRGEGDIRVTHQQVIFTDNVKLTPGPDYKLYAIKKYTEREDEFVEMKADSLYIADIKMFKGEQRFMLPKEANLDEYEALLVWCEAFEQFISVAKLNTK